MTTKATFHLQEEMFIVIPHIVSVKKEETEKYNYKIGKNVKYHSLKIVTDGDPIEICFDDKKWQEQCYSNLVTMIEDYYNK